MSKTLRNNSLSLVAGGLFLLSLVGQVVAGHAQYNDDQREHGQPQAGYVAYLRSPHFFEATFENWESEFLQMAVFIFLTAFLIQKGSAESRKPEEEKQRGQVEPVEEDPAKHRKDPDAPWPVRRGGWVAKLYASSLSLALFLLFLASFAAHVVSGARHYSQEQLQHGGQAVGALEYLGTARLWFESFQNWQSEFLSVLAIVVLSIFLRQRGSPESKPVHVPHEQTGNG